MLPTYVSSVVATSVLLSTTITGLLVSTDLLDSKPYYGELGNPLTGTLVHLLTMSPNLKHYMKATKIMLAILATIIITWLSLSSLVYFCSETDTFRQCTTSGGVLMIMLLFGWIPSIIVAMDLDQKLS